MVAAPVSKTPGNIGQVVVRQNFWPLLIELQFLSLVSIGELTG